MKRSVLTLFLLVTLLRAFSQNLDRISISSGGKATDEVNFVIGETFNFSIAGNGNITFETGTLGSSIYTGGVQTGVSQPQPVGTKIMTCYPNPATDAVYFTSGYSDPCPLNIVVCNMDGKQLLSICTENKAIMKLDLHVLAPGSYIARVSGSEKEIPASFQFIKN